MKKQLIHSVTPKSSEIKERIKQEKNCGLNLNVDLKDLYQTN